MTRFAAICLLAGMVLALAGSPAAAEIYVWQGPDGSMHYSDKPRHEGYKKREAEESDDEADYVSEDLDRLALDRHIARLSRVYSIDPNLIRAVIKVESNFNPLALSHKGAMGLMQLMPETAKTVGVEDAYDPQQNVSGGVKYLHYLIRRTGGNMLHALASYNAGPNAVERHNGVPPYKETQNYVRKVVMYYRAYKQQADEKDARMQAASPVASAPRTTVSMMQGSF